jgi:hypothetical protein
VLDLLDSNILIHLPMLQCFHHSFVSSGVAFLQTAQVENAEDRKVFSHALSKME